MVALRLLLLACLTGGLFLAIGPNPGRAPDAASGVDSCSVPGGGAPPARPARFLGLELGGEPLIFIIQRASDPGAWRAFEAAKAETARLVEELPAGARFAVIFFDRGLRQFPGLGRLAAASSEMRASAAAFIRAVPAGCGDCREEALELGLRTASAAPASRAALVCAGDWRPRALDAGSAGGLETRWDEALARAEPAVSLYIIDWGGQDAEASESLRRLALATRGGFTRVER